MDLLTILGIAVGLAMDAFAVSIATSVTLMHVTGRQLFRLSFHFGWFQFMMPMIGWLAGIGFVRFIAPWDHWVAFGLLAFIGCRGIYKVFTERGDHERITKADPTRGWNLIILSVATSIDALAVGLTFAMLEVRVWYACAIIGLVTASITLVGMLIGRNLGTRFGRWVEMLGGLILIGIGLKIVVEHLSSG
jgi:putative Mn2+ efflux pump MntP